MSFQHLKTGDSCLLINDRLSTGTLLKKGRAIPTLATPACASVHQRRRHIICCLFRGRLVHCISQRHKHLPANTYPSASLDQQAPQRPLERRVPSACPRYRPEAEIRSPFDPKSVNSSMASVPSFKSISPDYLLQMVCVKLKMLADETCDEVVAVVVAGA